MIIKSSRIIASKEGINATCKHVFEGKDNEEIIDLQGSAFDVKAMLGLAKAVQSKYAVRHLKIAPFEPITDEQAFEIVKLYCEEFKADETKAVIIRHQKPRADPKASPYHYHVYLPEVMEDQDYKIMDSHFSKIREEKLARLIEIKFNHHPILGRHNVPIIKQLRKEGHHDKADIIASNTPSFDPRDKPQSTFTSQNYLITKRKGVLLNQLRQEFKRIKASSTFFSEMVRGVENKNLKITKGHKANTYVLMTKDTGMFIGSANRFFGMKKNEFNRCYEHYVLGKDISLAMLYDAYSLKAQNKTSTETKETDQPPSIEKEGKSHSGGSGEFNKTIKNERPMITPTLPSNNPIIVGSERASITKGMSKQEIDMIMAYNEALKAKDEQLREILANQNKLNAILNQITNQFEKYLADMKIFRGTLERQDYLEHVGDHYLTVFNRRSEKTIASYNRSISDLKVLMNKQRALRSEIDRVQEKGSGSWFVRKKTALRKLEAQSAANKATYDMLLKNKHIRCLMLSDRLRLLSGKNKRLDRFANPNARRNKAYYEQRSEALWEYIEKDDIAFALNAKGNAADVMRDVARSAALRGVEKKKIKYEADIKSTQEILEFVRLMKQGDDRVKPFVQNFINSALAQEFEECKHICHAYMDSLISVVGENVEKHNTKENVNSHLKKKPKINDLFFKTSEY